MSRSTRDRTIKVARSAAALPRVLIVVVPTGVTTLAARVTT
jgi:hypothetical protein